MVPALLKVKASIKYIASAQGLSAKILARKARAEYAGSDYQEIIIDPEVNTVLITTRHNSHANMVLDCLKADKNVFVEKPLCLNEQELDEIIIVYIQKKNLSLTVGFNRRFSPFAVKMKQLLGSSPMNIIATMNAGFIPPEVWVHDLAIGGGRIIGEACHFIDLCSFLCGSHVIAVCMNSLGINPAEHTDNVSILLKYENGSNAVINYFANGSKAYSKERIEVFTQERTLILDNWKKLTAYGFKGFTTMKSRQDKGHNAQFALLNEWVQHGGVAIIPFESIVNTTRASFACIESMKKKIWIEIL
jgi:predicted dehydrogenase